MVISDYYKSLSENLKEKFRKRVLDETGMSYTTFYYKLRKHNWRRSEVFIINGIMQTLDHA